MLCGSAYETAYFSRFESLLGHPSHELFPRVQLKSENGPGDGTGNFIFLSNFFYKLIVWRFPITIFKVSFDPQLKNTHSVYEYIFNKLQKKVLGSKA